MAKVIKFALELKNGEQARTIDDLRVHFDIEKIVAYFLNGRLLTWLRHRHLDVEADAVEALSSDDAEFAKKLCDILGVAYEKHLATGAAIDANALKESHERMNALRQITSDSEILAKIDRVAFDQKDLLRLASDNEPEVYLCNGRFVIPLICNNKHYIGLGKVEAVIASDEVINFEERHIRFTNVRFDDDYQKIAETENPKIWAEKGNDAYDEENYSEAMKWCQKAADAGNADAMHTIGEMYHYGQGVEQDIGKALEYYTKAATGGWEPAMVDLGDMYKNGEEVSQDYGKAMEWYRKAADAEDGEAMNRIANMYYIGEGVSQDYSEAVKWYQKSADVGFDWGMNNLANMYYIGEGVSQDYGKAMEWFKKAADDGNGDAMNSLGNMYFDGNGVSQDYGKALEWYKKSAKEGNGDAMFMIAKMNMKGFGVSQNPAEVLKWYKKAADNGNSDAMACIGAIYHEGIGVEIDYREAMKWQKMAAGKGRVQSMVMVGGMYQYGETEDGVPDYGKAMEWFNKAAERGDGDAMFSIGVMYYCGEGVECNYSMAQHLIERAANFGSEEAQNWLKNH